MKEWADQYSVRRNPTSKAWCVVHNRTGRVCFQFNEGDTDDQDRLAAQRKAEELNK